MNDANRPVKIFGWTLTPGMPEDPGYYWVMRQRDGQRWVNDCPVLIRDDGGGCWPKDAIGHRKIEQPKAEDLNF